MGSRGKKSWEDSSGVVGCKDASETQSQYVLSYFQIKFVFQAKSGKILNSSPSLFGNKTLTCVLLSRSKPTMMLLPIAMV